MSNCCPCDDEKEPGLETIRPGLPVLPRQVRGFSDARRALLASLGTQPAWSRWRAREGDDFAVLLVEMRSRGHTIPGHPPGVAGFHSCPPCAQQSIAFRLHLGSVSGVALENVRDGNRKRERQPGESCIHASQCTTNECSGTTSNCGVCNRLAATGEDCNVYGVSCPPGQECAATGCQDAVPMPEVVWSEVAAGEQCSSFDRCPQGYYCLGEIGVGGTCMLPPTPGSACGSIVRGGNVCTEGSYCAQDGYCRAMPPVGQPCDAFGTISVCADDAYCAEDGFCRAKPAAGQPCALVTYGTGSVCAENAYCENGVCAAKSGPGQPCQAAYTSNTLGECLEGLVCTCVDSCTTGACRYTREEGERCDDPNTECADGTECTGGRCVATDELSLFAQLCGE